jgi:hypothetical protein
MILSEECSCLSSSKLDPNSPLAMARHRYFDLGRLCGLHASMIWDIEITIVVDFAALELW